jgi:hypothetical protein
MKNKKKYYFNIFLNKNNLKNNYNNTFKHPYKSPCRLRIRLFTAVQAKKNIKNNAFWLEMQTNM